MKTLAVRIAAISLLLISFIVLLTGGFHIGKDKEPIFVDRTSGWEPKLNILLTGDEEKPEYVNAGELTREELLKTFPGHAVLHAKCEAYPMTAKDAFEGAVYYKNMHGQGHPNSAVGGEFKVYYCESSDAFFVATERFIVAFDRQTGDCILSERFGKYSASGCGKAVVYGTDESVQTEE